MLKFHVLYKIVNYCNLHLEIIRYNKQLLQLKRLGYIAQLLLHFTNISKEMKINRFIVYCSV